MTLLPRAYGFWTGAVFAALLVASSAAAHAAEAAVEAKPDTESKPVDPDYYELMRVFVDTFQEIDQNYVKEVDRRKLVEAAVRGMLEELDPYSDYIAPDDLDQFTEAISQEFGGVGIRVNWDRQARAIEVVTPMPGSPAYKAGIQAGDRLVEIAGKAVKDFPQGKEIDTAVEYLRGKPGEEIVVGVMHTGSKDIEKVSLKRELIQLDTVMGYSYDKDGKWNLMFDPEQKIGYIRLTHFTSRSAAEVREALKSLKKQGMKGLIIDLRFNPGGLLEAAVDISDMFIDQGMIVSTDGRNSAHRSWSAKSFGTFNGFPIAILINHYSASASEILSACLQDHHRAIIVGERSWGKGSVQDVIDLEDGKSALKLTTASYHRPSGKNIHRFPDSKETDEWGVTPDEGYVVEFSLDDMRKYQEDRQERDIIGKAPKGEFVDRQLQAAKACIEKQLKEPAAAEAKPEAEKKDEKPAKPEEKKASTSHVPARRLPLFAVPRRAAG
ncbi:S41 family peptidase [Planctomicrobium piriforme]|uniref:Carboxyl-terminal processing protease n=1 Tax=Planctomicrobium piriforme TaxID=1576369 RepID=A0A1I3T7B2_9PLAN|nr:S41 family peptidase [Planctomicrobium piriforme]SFJ66964.1 carboxyl-terminal processing protease [Planctomicrobium piriforme]